jgi:hypothetical protein
MNWMICLSNTGYEASLELRKLYSVVPDEGAALMGLVRVVDESGDAYLYPAKRFVPIAIQATLEQQLLAAA